MSDVPYFWRVLAFAIVCALFLAVDLRKPRGQRSRWREYTFLVGSGAGIALFGVVVDTVTSHISPDYFVLGKGLPSTQWTEVAAVGLRAGFGAGIVGGAIVLFFNPNPGRALDLFRVLGIPVALAATLGALGGLAHYFYGGYVLPVAEQCLESQRARLFTTVWFTHLGVYLGGFLGLVMAIRRVRSGPR